MLRSVLLLSLITLACVVDAPGKLAAQTGGNAAPVPGPYQAMPPFRQAANPYSDPRHTQNVPYWMRTQPRRPGDETGAAGIPAQQNFISGWVWSPNAPGQGGYPTGNQSQPSGQQPGAVYWPGSPRPAYGPVPWGPPGYPPGRWPGPLYGAPQGYGAPMQPNQ